MTKQKTLIACSAMAISAIALLTGPALAQAEECGQFAFDGLTVLNQDNGYRLEFDAVGPTVDAPVTSFNNRQAVADRGVVRGSITGREVGFTVFWDSGAIGDYSGSVNSNGKARGDTSSPNTGGSASWNFRTKLVCVS